MNRLEGNGGARFIRLMQQFGKSDGINITVATVTKAPPALAIRLDGDPFDLEGDELVISESLVSHTKTASISGGSVSGSTTSSSGHSHGISSVSINGGNVSFASPLKVGDKVIVIIAQDGQLYYVLDKVV